MKRILIAGNWKMNTNPASASSLANEIKTEVNQIHDIKSEVLICPPFTNLVNVAQSLHGSPVHLGAQNCYFEKSGAYTGEISLEMIKECCAEYVIIGHSERRSYFGETDEIINTKVMAALEAGITPILCIGESLEERQSGKTEAVLKAQIEKDLENIDKINASKIVIAYEPIWAIGTGVSAEPLQADQAHNFIREVLTGLFGKDEAESILLLYGGSMNDKNAKELLALKNVNGGLIGGASLKAESFVNIINCAEEILK